MSRRAPRESNADRRSHSIDAVPSRYGRSADDLKSLLRSIWTRVGVDWIAGDGCEDGAEKGDERTLKNPAKIVTARSLTPSQTLTINIGTSRRKSIVSHSKVVSASSCLIDRRGPAYFQLETRISAPPCGVRRP